MRPQIRRWAVAGPPVPGYRGRVSRAVSLPASVMPRPNIVDGALAVLFASVSLLEVFGGDLEGSLPAKAALALLPTLPLAWRTAAPLLSVAIATGGLALAVLLGAPGDEALVPIVAPVVAAYSLGAHASARRIVAGSAVALAAYAVAAAAGEGETSSFVLNAAAVVCAVAVGRAVRVMGFESDVLQARTSELERERDERAEAAVAEERARIARELHDVIGHSISVMGVQAGAVRRRLDDDQETEREVLLAVERVGRDAVDEMQRLLGFLRADGDQPGPGTPLTRARVDELVEEMRRAGITVSLTIDGDLDGLPAGRAMAAYRILQEAFTNVLRHAPGARVEARLVRTPAVLRLDVVDDGGESPSAPPGSGGHGLIGMRERASLYGGKLEAGPRPGGGFRVAAELPAGPG